MSNQMPSMPSANNQEILKEESVTASLPGEELTPIEDAKPEYVNPDTLNKANIDIPKFPKGGIEVVAIRKGFYNQTRIDVGKKFKVKKKEDLGEWMECVEFDLERERVKILKEKKEKAKL